MRKNIVIAVLMLTNVVVAIIKELTPTPVRAILEIEEYSKNPKEPRKVPNELRLRGKGFSS
jgi:hypothetical protein